MKRNVLAFDLGASSGRAVLGSFDGQKISFTKIHAFNNNPVMLRGTFHWDLLNLLFEIKQGLAKAKQQSEFDSIGIDTWGVDFGLLDKNGDLLQNPVHYRDARTVGLVPEVEALLGESLYGRTGIQIMELNTVFQLYALAQQHPDLLARADCALLMPDLLGYFLTGKKASEYSMASTTQLMQPHTGNWDTALMQKLGIPHNLFPAIVPSGTPLGNLSADIREELDLPEHIQVISTTGHDTAGAVVAAPAKDDDFIYISCGTWSLFGTELQQPIISDKSARYNITNEGGYGKSVLFLKNIIGLWLIQETSRQYLREGESFGYNDLEKHALAADAFRYFIDPDAPEFVAPGNLPQRIRAYCKKTGQGEPATVGEIMRCIYESIALKYRNAFEQIRDCTGKIYRHIHMIGGGTKDNLLCEMAAGATGCTILAGPTEATALGNIAVQLMALGDISSIRQAREVIRNSFEPIEYMPENTAAWDAAYEKFMNIITGGQQTC